jgi:magnesium chelatase family protein
MSFAKVYSVQNVLLKAKIITIEADITKKTLHAISIVGLPDKAVEESRDRVGAAIKNSGFKSFKSKNQKVVFSLAPADLKKEGPIFDLAIALAYLLAVEKGRDDEDNYQGIKFDAEKKIFLGELALNGGLRPIKGVLPLVRHAKEKGFEEIYLPYENEREAGLIHGIKIFGVHSLNEVINHLEERILLKQAPETKVDYEKRERKVMLDFSDIKGQERAKRGLEIAAAGGHNIAMYGPAGTGKTMLARAFSGILPRFDFDEVLEVTSIHSVVGALGDIQEGLVVNPPFRSPHHTSSYVSLVGGGTFPRPGEITLAHRGVLFLDEFPEFERRVAESLRQPLEDRIVSISRTKGTASFPANFILIAAMNPCPCGNFGTKKVCNCSPMQIDRYRKKLSGPIMDRIDLWVEVADIDHESLTERGSGKESEKVKSRVSKAREKQKNRFEGEGEKIKMNSEMGVKEITNLIKLTQDVKNILNESAKKLDLSARSYHKMIKLARTIADLEGSSEISKDHILEALQYRPKIFN